MCANCLPSKIAVVKAYQVRSLWWIITFSTGSPLHPASRWLCGWFGIRGVGSIYYLAYAFGHGLKGELGEQIAWITFTTIVISVILHGISSTPLMSWYERRIKPNVPDLI
jgi:sodium/hydrogen antiporter